MCPTQPRSPLHSLKFHFFVPKNLFSPTFQQSLIFENALLTRRILLLMTLLVTLNSPDKHWPPWAEYPESSSTLMESSARFSQYIHRILSSSCGQAMFIGNQHGRIIRFMFIKCKFKLFRLLSFPFFCIFDNECGFKISISPHCS